MRIGISEHATVFWVVRSLASAWYLLARFSASLDLLLERLLDLSQVRRE